MNSADTSYQFAAVMESQLGLLDLPEEVIEGLILKYLDWNDILRFRRVCHATKTITQSYLRINSTRAPEIEINEITGKSFAAFLDMGIPTTKLFINNQSGYHIFEDLISKDSGKSRKEFMAIYGPLIKHLRVIQMTIWPKGKELDFLNSLVNIKTLNALHFGWGSEVDSKIKAARLVNRATKDLQLYNYVFPNSFKGLENIQIVRNTEDEIIQNLMINREIFAHLHKLKYASLPFTWKNDLPSHPIQVNIFGSLMDQFASVGYYTNPRPNDLYSEPGQLEQFDFINYHDDIGGWDQERIKTILPVLWGGSLSFLMLCDSAVKTGLRLENVSPFWFYARDARDGRFSGNNLGIPVVSLRGLDPSMMSLHMPNLEMITIPHTSRCGICDQDGKPEWPALKSLDVTVDDWIVKAWDFKEQNDWQDGLRYLMTGIGGLWRVLFKDVVRTNLVDLKLKFEETGRWRERNDLNGIVPRIDDILLSCPNLRKIELNNWQGTNKALVKLWERLLGLEEISLIGCTNVGNVTFVGSNREKPVFFNLKNLKKLTLKGLEKMPKITDLSFTLVLANMSLKELVLSSDKPLEKVTKDGIGALLNGLFAQSIEKFEFRNWSLAGMSAEEFKKLGKMFRSHEMI